MAQYMRPDGDDAQTGDWEPEPSDTTLWDTMDETSPNDSDYVWHNAVEGGYTEWFRVTLGNPVGEPGTGVGTLRWRLGRIDGAKTIYIRVYLRQGATPKFTGPERLVTDSWTTHSETVSQIEMDAITDWNDLNVHFVVSTVSGGGKPSDPAISWCEFEVPDAGILYIPKIMMIT